MRGLGSSFTIPVGIWGMCDMYLRLGCGVVGGGGGWVYCGRLGPGSGRVGCYYLCVCCKSGLSVYMTGPGICILC